MRKTGFTLGVLAGALVLVFGLFGESHSARTTRAQQGAVGAGFKPAFSRSATPPAKGISSLPPEAQASIRAALRRDLPAVINPFEQLAELTASDGAGFDELGFSVAISGNTVVAGAGGNSSDTGGVVYVFVKPETGWANMTQTAELTASDGVEGNSLGYSVAISGNTVVAGAPGATVGGDVDRGAAYIFVEPAAGWVNMTETAKLIAFDGAREDNLGQSVAMASTGNTVVVGAPGNDGTGAAYVFVKPASGWKTTATFRAKLTASDGMGGGELGASVDISGNTIVAGAPGESAAYVFVKPANGWASMTQTAELTGSEEDVPNVGSSVAVNGSTVVAGASHASPGYKYQGAAYVFVEPANGWANMTQTDTLTASDGREDDQLGFSVATNGNVVAAGATQTQAGGAVYIFVEPKTGWTNVTQSGELHPSDEVTLGEFGHSVALSGSTVVAGDLGANSNDGAAYVFGFGQSQ